MKKVLFLLIGVAIGVAGMAQTALDKREAFRQTIRQSAYRKGTTLVGLGLANIGFNVRGGIFWADRAWVGGVTEYTLMPTIRRDWGVATRYYLLTGLESLFLEGGYSYGHFENFDFFGTDSIHPGWKYESGKVNLGLGAEIHLSKRISFEGGAKISRLTNTNIVLKTITVGLNARF